MITNGKKNEVLENFEVHKDSFQDSPKPQVLTPFRRSIILRLDIWSASSNPTNNYRYVDRCV